jgi:DNA-binding transcriptional LysR family regulator
VDWNHLQHFLALARTGSVRAAGAALEVSHSTVLRRVEALEETLGARLFDRSRDGFALTAAGREMLPRAERVAAEVASIARGVAGRDTQLEGPISLTCGDAWVADLLLAELRPFFEAHPSIHLRMGVESRLFDMSKREADIAVRVMPRGQQPPQHLIGTVIAPVHMCTYVGADHADRLDPDLPDTEARWVSFDDVQIQRAHVARTRHPDLPLWGGFSDLGLVVSAVAHGYGVGILPSYVGDAEPALRRLRDARLTHLGDLWLLSHPDLRSNARLRACRQAIVQAAQRRMGRFDGTGPLPHPAVPDSHQLPDEPAP